MSQWDSEENAVVEEEEEPVLKGEEAKVIADAKEAVREADKKDLDIDNTSEKVFDEGVDTVEEIPKGKEKQYGI